MKILKLSTTKKTYRHKLLRYGLFQGKVITVVVNMLSGKENQHIKNVKMLLISFIARLTVDSTCKNRKFNIE